MRRALTLLAAALVLSACGMQSSAPTTTATTTTTTTIPEFSLGNYSNYLVAEVQKDMAAEGLVVGRVLYDCSNTIPAGRVLSQVPAPGTRVRRDVGGIELLVSKGSCAPPCLYTFVDSDGATLCSPSPVLTDPTTLDDALTTAASQLTGTYVPQNQYAPFVAQFDALQIAQERLGGEGKPWYVPDPASEASAFINANDYDAVLALRASKLGGVLNCMINPGLPQCV